MDIHRRALIPISMATLLALIALPTAGRADARRHPPARSALVRAAAHRAASVHVSTVAGHLDQPKKVTVAANGDLVVALSGDGRAPAGCTDSDELSCRDASGGVDEISPSGGVTPLLRGVTSIASAHDQPQATGPVEAILRRGQLHVLFQDLDLDNATGVSRFGRGSLLGDLADFSVRRAGARGSGRVEARLGEYEAAHEPDRHVLGSAVSYGYEGAINSDPYSIVAYRGGWAIADAGANDVLWVSPAGRVRVLAVLGTIAEHAAAGTYGSAQTSAIEAAAQAVPTALAVGPDGALYIGELGGAPYARDSESIYRLSRDGRLSVYAHGFTAIGDISFDARGRLLVLEIDAQGLSDPGLATGTPASGALIALDGHRRRVLISHGLSMPGGLATDGDDIYITDDSTTTDGGKLLRVRLS